ncbi:MAG: hypothetical protein CSA10_01090 [Cardiobacteriales bacterium]|nr:MAG: hypothetical protein CSA10_01090 [Cardiobacteriales bacterium]
MKKNKKKKRNKNFIDELTHYPLAKALEIQQLIDKESNIQHSRLFRSITFGRLIVAVVLFAWFASTEVTKFFLIVPAIYIVASMWVLHHTKRNNEHTRLYALFYALFDLVAFALLIHFSNHDYELSFIFFTLAFNAMLLSFSQLVFVTCWGAIFLIVGWYDMKFPDTHLISTIWNSDFIDIPYKTSDIATLVMGLFFSTFTIYNIVKHSLKNEIGAIIQRRQMNQLLSFTRSVIENFKDGILIFTADTDTSILNINKKAIELLNLKSGQAVLSLYELSPQLFKQYKDWSSSLFDSFNTDDSFTYQHNEGAEEVFVSFSEFSRTNQGSVIMVTLESVNKTMQQAQENKLISLGRLTAGVAHEIRNPLASIHSAADLLKESNNEEVKHKLVDIINKNVRRTNRIISNILGLFRERKAERTLLPVAKTLDEFVESFKLSNNDKAFKLTVTTELEEPLYIKFDLTQLEQILWNLASNSIKYSESADLKINIHYGLSDNRRRLFLYVSDNGKGIDEKRATKIFEPFYAGSAEGSGLGLYLAKELCAANNANITYLLPTDRDFHLPQRGACFRIATTVYFSKSFKPKIPNERPRPPSPF